MKQRGLVIALVGAALAGLSATPGEAANCSLRNPDRQIYAMFPDATSYRSVVAEVDQTLKALIEERLGRSLSFGDLGKHTIYIVLKETAPIGFVHARSEIGASGTVELVWALSLDLSIMDFRVQRARERNIQHIKTASFREKLVGQDLDGLLLSAADGTATVDASALGIPPEACDVACTAVLCGAKTRHITDLAFGQVVHKARLLGNVHRFFPETAKVTAIPAMSAEAGSTTAEQLAGFSPDQTDDAEFTLLRSIGPADKLLGYLVFSRWKAYASSPEIWCAVSPDGKVVDTVIVG